MAEKAHSLQTSAELVKAAKISEFCYQIQQHFDHGKYIEMVQTYRHFLVHGAEFIAYLKHQLQKHTQQARIDGSDCPVLVPSGWKLKQTSDSNFKLIPTTDWLELAEEAEHFGKKYVQSDNSQYKVVYENYQSQDHKSVSCVSAKGSSNCGDSPDDSGENSEYFSLASDKVEKPVSKKRVIGKGPKIAYKKLNK